MVSIIRPPFAEISGEVFRRCYEEVSGSERGLNEDFADFRDNVVEGRVSHYRLKELRVILKALACVYAEQVSLVLNVNKGDIVTQIRNLRERALPQQRPAKPVPALPKAGGGNSPYLKFQTTPRMPPRDVSEDNSPYSFSLPSPADPPKTPGLFGPKAPPDVTVHTHDYLRQQLERAQVVWTSQSLHEYLERNRQLHGHQQPQYPTIRWLGADAITVARATKGSIKTRTQLKFTLTHAEHGKVTNTRKRQYGLHLVCLMRSSLYPAQWPEGLVVKVDQQQASVPHTAWRSKDESRDWCRVVSPVDLTNLMNPLNRTMYFTVEYTKVHQSVVLATCLVEAKGITALCDETRARILASHESEAPANPETPAHVLPTDPSDTPPVFPSVAVQPPSPLQGEKPHALSQASHGDEVLVDRTTVPVYDPVTMARIEFPVKGERCAHPGAFDLQTYIHFCCSSRLWCCPECEQPAGVHNLRYDPYFASILASDEVQGNKDVSHVVLRANGQWEVKHADAGTADRSRKRSLPEPTKVDGSDDEGDDTGLDVDRTPPVHSGPRRVTVLDDELLEFPTTPARGSVSSASARGPASSKRPRRNSAPAAGSCDNPIEL
eukprot:TRINITY_DN26097_c0_g1_i1.p1 TRINITY_DN26097_c0_g1~~TRINITY_DN26097_c0_g1_i1.p1  ORF type:complete len:606 (+),score=116.03 TRINITY_DN26097_c0_g1_i1:112-1929(+)